MTDKCDVDELIPSHCSFVRFHPIHTEDKWKVNFALEATDVKFRQLEVDGFNNEETEEIIEFLCCS